MATDGKSRIPKFSFGFRRTTKVQDEPSAPLTLEPPSIVRSATPTNPPASRSAESSPKVSRSKSLRLPRPTKYGLKSHSQSSIPEPNQNGYNGDNDLVPDVKSVKLNNSRNSLSPRGRSLTVSGHMSSSSNQSSRSNSPSVSTASGGSEKRRLVPKSDGVQSLSQADEDAQFERFQRRTQSFNATRRSNHARSDSLGNGEKLAAPQFARNHPSRRAKTPTSSYKSTSNGLQMKKSSVGVSGGSVGGGGDKVAITRTTSLGKVNRIQRAEEGTPTSNPPSRRFSSDPKGKRPSSMVGRNNTPDLNTLAHEMTSNDQSESRISRPPSSKIPPPLRSRRSQSALDHHPHAYTRHTPSPSAEAVTSTTTSQASGSNSSNEGPGVKSYEQPTIASAAKISRPNSSNSQYKMSRQGSFGSQSNLSSASGDSHKYELNKKKSVTNLDSIDGGGGSGRATPTGGRGTPIGRKKGPRDSLDSSTVSSTTGKVGSGLPPRTPYRVARTMIPPSSGAAGINELEGSVLLEADDYLRVCHDVKALKTSLLRLKREIQTDSSSPMATGVGGSSRVGRSRTSPNTDASGSTLTDLKKKLKQVTSDRDKALEEVGSLKKDNTSLSSKVDVLTSDLSSLKETHSKLEVESRQIEGHRDMLLDKVERLHADNHKLENRLMSYEKASIYEQTISDSWLDELDGDESLADIEEDEMEYEGHSSEVNDHIT